MEVRSSSLWLVFGFVVLSACNQKSPGSTFPESKAAYDPCKPTRIQNRFVVRWEDGRITTEKAENKEVFIKKFLTPRLNEIRFVEFDKVVKRSVPEVNSNQAVDSMASLQWGLDTIEANYAWSRGIKGQGVKVGVVDEAVDFSHPQIKPRLAVNLAEFNGTKGSDDDGNGYVDDLYGWDFLMDQSTPSLIEPSDGSTLSHGTHVAGIIAADPTKGSLSGVAPQAEIIPANFLNESQGTLSAAISALKYTASRGAKIINASWGGCGSSPTLREVVSDLLSNGVLFVAAAGNESRDLDYFPVFPGGFGLPLQLTVAASRSNDQMAGFSNTSYNLVHLAAPGDTILSTIPGGSGYMSGTSMAAPMVSGAAALLWSAHPTATLAQVRTALLNSVDVRSLRVITQGRLNVRRALLELDRIVAQPQVP